MSTAACVDANMASSEDANAGMTNEIGDSVLYHPRIGSAGVFSDPLVDKFMKISKPSQKLIDHLVEAAAKMGKDSSKNAFVTEAEKDCYDSKKRLERRIARLEKQVADLKHESMYSDYLREPFP